MWLSAIHRDLPKRPRVRRSLFIYISPLTYVKQPCAAVLTDDREENQL
ncbi:hypothetical protein SPFM12_00177 [Salmonella phage SPFM12]|nr:hypothetical protein SPFM12_00177 [Salmonella phage SPFM12]